MMTKCFTRALFFIGLFFAGAAATDAQTCAPRPGGIVAWYRAENNANDFIGGNHGTLQGGATFAAGKVGQAFSLNGTDAYVQAPSTAANDPTTAGSMEAWVMFNQTPSAAGHIMTIIGKGALSADFDLQAETDNKFHFYVAGGLQAASTTVIQTGVWYHVVGTWDSTVGLKLYVNGNLENTNNFLTTRNQSGRPLQIGNQPFFGPRLFSGLIDEVSLYNRALTASEVQAIFNAGSDGKCLTVTAASVTISGRVVTASGRGLSKAVVRLTEQDGATRTALTGSFGYYSFTDVPVGQTVILEVSSKRFDFGERVRVLNVGEDITDANFVASP